MDDVANPVEDHGAEVDKDTTGSAVDGNGLGIGTSEVVFLLIDGDAHAPAPRQLVRRR